jgi:hypothetical protein
MSDSDGRLRCGSRIYEKLLWLYPRAHREAYGSLMAQFFRDQCRAASPGNSRALVGLWLGTLVDLFLSVFREHLSNPLDRMKNLSRNTLSLILFIAAIGAALFSLNFIPGRINLALGLAYFSALTLLLRALLEWSRPANELVRSLIWGAAIAVIFAFIFPVWGRFNLPIIPWLVVTPIFLNALVPMINVGRHFASRRT